MVFMTVGAAISFFVYQILIPFLFTIFFVTFMWGAFTYIIAGGPDEEAKERGKALLMYAFLGFLLMVVVWGGANFIRALI